MSQSQEMHKLALEKDNRFEYAFLGLTFAILSLSIEFLPQKDAAFKYLLVFSWIFLLTSGAIGGVMLKWKPTTLKYLVFADSYENWVDYVNANPDKTLLARDTREPLDKVSFVEFYNQKIKENKDIAKSHNKWYRVGARVQMAFFLIGLILNVFFVSLNFLGFCS